MHSYLGLNDKLYDKKYVKKGEKIDSKRVNYQSRIVKKLGSTRISPLKHFKAPSTYPLVHMIQILDHTVYLLWPNPFQLFIQNGANSGD